MKRATKDVLHVGRWLDPKTRRPVAASVRDLELLARNTNAWIDAGHRVWFPDGHSDAARDDMGEWSNFRVEGDRLVADVVVNDDEAEAKLGRTLREVSPAIEDAPLASDGRQFGPTIIHVAATPQPVVTHQGNFVLLARAPALEAQPMEPEKAAAPGAPQNGAPAAASPAAKPVASPPSATSVMGQIAALLGLGPDVDEGGLVEAIRQLKAAADVAAEAEAMMPKEMAKVTELARTLDAKVKATEAKFEALRAESAEREIGEAKTHMLSRGNVVLEKDDEETVRALFAGGQEKAARSFLALSRKRADEAAGARPKGRLVLSRQETDDRAKAQRAADDEMLAAMGVKVNSTGKGA